jgi:hypothetical protein
LSSWSTHSDRDHHFSLRYPEEISGEPVTTRHTEENGLHRVHLQSLDQSELYFEVVSYDQTVDHQQGIQKQRNDLSERSPDGTFTAEVEQDVGSIMANGFDFEGFLEGRWKVRRFLYLDGPDRTYRIVFDPTSELNVEVLGTFALD